MHYVRCLWAGVMVGIRRATLCRFGYHKMEAGGHTPDHRTRWQCGDCYESFD